MTQAVIECFKNNRFFRTLDFQPKTNNGGVLLHDRVAKKTFAADRYTVTVQERDHDTLSPQISYIFSDSQKIHIAFYMDKSSGKCMGISGDDGKQPGIKGLKSTCPEQSQPMDQDSINSILDNFLTGLRNVYTGQDFEKLVLDSLQKLPFIFPPTPGIAPPSP